MSAADATGWTVKSEVLSRPTSKVARPQTDKADFQVHRPDTALFATLQGLQMQSGVPIHRLGRLTLKELADNALDAADAAGRPGQVQIKQIGDRAYVIEDQGHGMPGSPDDIASLFSLGRVMISSKFWRLPSRGCLGNGLRIIVGTVAATGGTIEITTRNRTHAVAPAEVRQDRDRQYRGRGSSGRDTAGGDLRRRVASGTMGICPGRSRQSRWRRRPARHIRAPPTRIGLTRISSPRPLSIIEPPETTVRQFVERLDGCAGAKAGQMVSQFGKGRTCRSMTEADARDLLSALQAQCTGGQARGSWSYRRSCIQSRALRLQQAGWRPSPSAHTILSRQYHSWLKPGCSVANRKGDDVSISCQCNRTPIVGTYRGISA